MNLVFSYRGHNINNGLTVNGCIWENVLEKIKKNVTPLTYVTWFEDSKLCLVNENEFAVIVSTRVQKRHLDENYKEMVIEYLTDAINKVKIEQKELEV